LWPNIAYFGITIRIVVWVTEKVTQIARAAVNPAVTVVGGITPLSSHFLRGSVKTVLLKHGDKSYGNATFLW
jgi:hypothetical protein